MIVLDDRLECVASYAKGDTVCDIGCDHGKLCGYLLQNDMIKKAIGVDISEPSLAKAKELKQKLNYSDDKFELLVGDGLAPLNDKDFDTIIICGIGSNITCGIIEKNLEIAKRAKRIILCPLKNTFTVREFLYDNGFTMECEDMIFENGRYYNIFVATPGEFTANDDVDIYVGRKLKGNELLKPWLIKRVNDMTGNINEYKQNAKEGSEHKLANMERMLNAYQKGLDELC